MRLDITVLRYLSREDWRILQAIEMGMKNHDLVPTDLIVKIGRLHRGGTFKAISNLHKHKLIYHENKIYDGYRLTYLGYDFLCLKAMGSRGTVDSVGTRIGVGKESDVYACSGPNDIALVLKLARLGRISFRNIKQKRDYLVGRKSASWIYMSRLAAFREYSYMKILSEHGLPVPKPYDWSRHGVLMDRVDGFNLAAVKEVDNVESLYRQLMAIILQFSSFGLIHCDFNEFNIMVTAEGKVVVIDFPQMVSMSHENAQWYFERDVNCIVTFFSKRFGFESDYRARWEDAHVGEIRIDKLVKASGVNSSVGMPSNNDDEENVENDELYNQNVPEEESSVVPLESGNAPEKEGNQNDNNKDDDDEPIPDIPVDKEEDEEEDEAEREERERARKDEIRANVRKDLRKKQNQKVIKSQKRQGKRERQRAGMQKVKDYTKSDSTGW